MKNIKQYILGSALIGTIIFSGLSIVSAKGINATDRIGTETTFTGVLVENNDMDANGNLKYNANGKVGKYYVQTRQFDKLKGTDVIVRVLWNSTDTFTIESISKNNDVPMKNRVFFN